MQTFLYPFGNETVIFCHKSRKKSSRQGRLEITKKHGELLAEAVCAFLAGRRIRKGMGVIAPEYIVGESFPRD